MLALLLAAAGQTAVDAERAFNRAAQTQGQWTAFRAFAASDAVIFKPEPAKAEFPDKDPPIAVQWWPAESYVSCDGATAVNTGPWVRPDSFGYFTTIWRKGVGGWKFALDHGDVLHAPRPLPESPSVQRASCDRMARPAPPVLKAREGERVESGISSDHSLAWSWLVRPDGSRIVAAWQWTRPAWTQVIRDEVGPAAK